MVWKPWMPWTMKNTPQNSWLFSESYLALRFDIRVLSKDSAKRKGLNRTSLSGFTWLPLASISETKERAQDIIGRLRKRIEEKAEAGLLIPGLKEQYDIQLEELEMRGNGDCEILFYPRYFGIGGMFVVKLLSNNYSRDNLQS